MRTKKTKVEPHIPSMSELLRRVPFFSDLDEAAIGRFAGLATVQNFQHEETIILAGDSRNALFFITKGQAKIFSDSKSSGGIVLSLLGIGDSFGEIQVFSETGRSTISVKAEGECSVIIFGAKNFFNEITSNPKLSMEFLREESHKLNKAYMYIAALSRNTIRKRVMACIMLFIEELGVQVTYGNRSVIKLRNRPTQEQIAGMSGTTRETVNREISFLIKEGYIELNNKDLILLKDLPIE